MSSNKDGIIIILSSPSGAGKTTLVKKKFQKLLTFTLQFLTLQEFQELMS